MVMVCCGLWLARNEKVWRNITPNLEVILARVKRFWSAWQQAQKQGANRRNSQQVWSTLKTPIAGRIKLNNDAVEAGDGIWGLSWVTWVIRDSLVSFIAGGSSEVLEKCSVREA
ncbi:unnamed protein product [Cuscuta epithymum]|uniref:Uncharacterized protein n=1 Tax=Cuscuta epithymum TaxID=186058 RepID=A0AAV0EE46_9ASTE|nr:unnamed protein product [Cuscuta epithymum]